MTSDKKFHEKAARILGWIGPLDDHTMEWESPDGKGSYKLPNLTTEVVEWFLINDVQFKIHGTKQGIAIQLNLDEDYVDLSHGDVEIVQPTYSLALYVAIVEWTKICIQF